MGYTTYFEGGFTFNKPVTVKLYNKINDFAEKRHDGEEFPGYYCQWVIDSDYDGEEALVWDQNEKFYDYVEWLEYLIKNFFEPEGYVLNGSVEFNGEEPSDFGTIDVKDNVVELNYGIHELDLSDIDLSKIDTQALIREVERRGYYVE